MGQTLCCVEKPAGWTIQSGHLQLRASKGDQWALRTANLLRVGDGALLQFVGNRLGYPSRIKIDSSTLVTPFKFAQDCAVCSKSLGERPHGFKLTNQDFEKKTEYYLDPRSQDQMNMWTYGISLAASSDAGTVPTLRSSSIGDMPKYGGGLHPIIAECDMSSPLTVVLFGATGDLARKKLFPALHQLMYGCPDAPLMPPTTRVVGYGRSEVDLAKFKQDQMVNVKGPTREKYLNQITFFAGAYDKEESYAKLNEYLLSIEGGGKANRIFFFSVPPTIFVDVCKHVKAKACAPKGGFTRLIIEKPFGRDSQSFAELNKVTSKSFSEEQLFRIDHYLGKEVVLNLTTLRFGNQIFEPIWNKEHIQSVQIIFKEDLGTGGRGGYFDNFGIIRDIMQNHLLQVLLWLAIEPPKALDRDNIAKEKVKLLKCVKALSMKDCFIGQFGKNSWTINGQTHEEPGYLDDETVPAGSTCPTYAAVALDINNSRWKGVPFIMRAGKGLDERMGEVRVTFKSQAYNKLVPGGANELVMRIQPEEAIYLKCLNKAPGWQKDLAVPVVLDMSYNNAFPGQYVADAYERMFLNTFKGDGSLFVGSGELTEAWRIFTPLLNEIETKKPQPVIYPFGVRVPAGCDVFMKKYNVAMSESWQEYIAWRGKSLDGIKEFFDAIDKDRSGTIEGQELKAFAKRFCDGREPSDKEVAKIMSRIDRNGDDRLSFQEVLQCVEQVAAVVQPEAKRDHNRMTAKAKR